MKLLASELSQSSYILIPSYCYFAITLENLPLCSLEKNLLDPELLLRSIFLLLQKTLLFLQPSQLMKVFFKAPHSLNLLTP